jgi:hypothetical protein
VFNFFDFATEIYRERFGAHSTPYLLPALYGGELGPHEPYEALFVLQDPSRSYTEKNWKPCGTVSDAIERHRSIFRSWAFEPESNQAALFGSFSLQPPRRRTRRSFFQRFYVTDIWKDGKPGDYWLRKLSAELREVQADVVVFVGSEGRRGEEYVEQARKFYIPHPGAHGVTRDEYRKHVEALIGQITVRHLP